MKLQRFTVHRPTSLAEAVEMRSNLGEDAAFYAGGTELLLVMKLGLADYSHLIDLKRIEQLSALSIEDEEVCIGASMTYQAILRSPELNRRFPGFLRMLSGIGNLRVRTTGTLGGNLAFADPHSDPLTFLIAANASVGIVGVDGRSRRIPIEQFTHGPYATSLEPGEVLATIRIPLPSQDARFAHAHVRFRERPALTVSAAGVVRDGTLWSLGLVVGAIEGVPRRIDVKEAVEAAGSYDAAKVQELVSQTVEPVDDLDGSSDYKRHLAGVVAGRLLGDLTVGSGGQNAG